jgi:hypothetical protein
MAGYITFTPNLHISQQLLWDIWFFLSLDERLFQSQPHDGHVVGSILRQSVEVKWSNCLDINQINLFESRGNQDTDGKGGQIRVETLQSRTFQITIFETTEYTWHVKHETREWNAKKSLKFKFRLWQNSKISGNGLRGRQNRQKWYSRLAIEFLMWK